MHPHNPDWDRVVRCGKYRAIFCPTHPRAWPNGYLYVHIIVAELKIGRLLANGEVVHHMDHNKKNNSPENIEVLSASDHSRVHARPKTMLELTCAACNRRFKRRLGNEARKKGYKHNYCSRTCSGRASRASQLRSRSSADRAAAF